MVDDKTKRRRSRKFIRQELGIKPKGTPRTDEHDMQVKCLRWLKSNHPDLYKVIFAVPNGSKRDGILGKWLKDEGMRAGVADLILLKANEKYGALCVEMKTPSGKQEPVQKRWQKDCEMFGSGKYVICRSFEDFKTIIDNYINNI